MSDCDVLRLRNWSETIPSSIPHYIVNLKILIRATLHILNKHHIKSTYTVYTGDEQSMEELYMVKCKIQIAAAGCFS